MGDHTEALQVVYDPSVITYEGLLDVFWARHRPTSEPYSRQYRSAVFVADDAQRASAQASVQAAEVRLDAKVYTAIETATPFYSAEDYHQKYRLRRQKDVVAALEARYGTRWIDSTAAARLNGLYGGHPVTEPLESLGLSDEALAVVAKRAAR